MMFKSKIAVLASTLLLSGVAASADLTTGLAAHYSFDDCKATDSSGNNNNGTITGNLQCTKGMLGKGVLFDGASYISVPSSSSLHPVNQWTTAFWVRDDGMVKDWTSLVHKGGVDNDCASNREYSTWLFRSSSFSESTAGDGGCRAYVTSKTITTVGKWLHYVGIVDRVNHIMKIYINGQLSAQQTDTYSAFNNNNYDLRIGFSEGGGMSGSESPFKGALDDMRFYNRALSDSEIKTLYTMSQPISGTVKGVQQYSATCTNVNTGQTKTIALRDGMLAWNCKAAGLKTSPGDNINISIDAVSW